MVLDDTVMDAWGLNGNYLTSKADGLRPWWGHMSFGVAFPGQEEGGQHGKLLVPREVEEG